METLKDCDNIISIDIRDELKSELDNAGLELYVTNNAAGAITIKVFKKGNAAS